ncbi:MAG: DNA polymerase III subunit gamma/tau [Angelakisella sp.]
MYQALYRKWRPRTFEDVVGQEHITTTLKNEIAAGKPAHAYLLMGSRGTGKTTCAKLIAKAVNCLNPHEGSPCGACEVCLGIDNGSMVDVSEIDAASNNGVDNIRDLRDEAHFLPNMTRYRVYIIDEAHMLSIGAVNALLKIMEEPPAHVIFILATTEVHKMPATIQSRCQRFDFNRIDSAVIAGRLRVIANAEGIEADDEALTMMARLADGGMRDAISLLDLCWAHGNVITPQTVGIAAGMIGQDYLFDLGAAVAKQSLSDAMEVMGTLGGQAVEYDQLCQQLITHYRNLMIAGSVAHPEKLIVCLPEALERYKQQAKATGGARILYVLRTLQETAAIMTRSASRRTELELCLAKLCDPRLSISPEALLTRVEELEAKLNAVMAGTVVSVGSAASPPPERRPDVVAVPPPPKPIKPAVEEPVVLMPQWPEVLERLGKSNPALRGALLDSKGYQSGNRVLVDSGNAIFREMMRTNDYTRASLKQAIAEVTGTKYSIGPYDRPTEQVGAEQQSPLDSLLQNAAESGIEIKTIGE